MAFVDTKLPKWLSQGSKGGPGYRTHITRADSGAESRATNWPDNRSRLAFTVAKELQTRPEIADLVSMWRVMRGAGRGWRFRDDTDWTTSQRHNLTPSGPTGLSPMDPPITDGTTKVFQLRKGYLDSNSGRIFYRPITRPVPPGDPDHSISIWVFATFPVFANDQPFGGWENFIRIAVDYDSGRVHLENLDGTAVIAGVPLAASFAFDVPARFSHLPTEQLAVRTQGEGKMFVNLPVTELAPDHCEGTEAWGPGGSSDVTVTAFPHVLDVDVADHVRLSGHGQDHIVWVRDPVILRDELGGVAIQPEGGPFCVVENGDATNRFHVYEQGGGRFVGTWDAGDVGQLYWMGTGTGWKA